MKLLCALFGVSVVVPLLAGCVGESPPGVEGQASPSSTEARGAETATAREMPAGGVGGGAEERARGGEEAGAARALEATLRFAGDRGTAFSGECVAGGEIERIDGRVPGRHVFRLDGRGLECEIHKDSRGTLRTEFLVGDDRYVQSAGGRRASMRFAYSERGFSSSVGSATPAGSSSRSTVSSSSG